MWTATILVSEPTQKKQRNKHHSCLTELHFSNPDRSDSTPNTVPRKINAHNSVPGQKESRACLSRLLDHEIERGKKKKGREEGKTKRMSKHLCFYKLMVNHSHS